MEDVKARNVGVDHGLSLEGEMKHGVHTKRMKIHISKASQRLMEAGKWRWGREACRSWCREWMGKESAERALLMDAEKVPKNGRG